MGGASRRWQHSDAGTAAAGPTLGGSTSTSAAGRPAEAGRGGAAGGDAPEKKPAGSPDRTPPRRLLRNTLVCLVIGLASSSAGAYLTLHALQSQGLGFCSDAESLTRFDPDAADAEARRVEQAINEHPLVASLRQRADLTESRPHLKMPARYRARSLTGGALAGPGKVPVPAYAWTEQGGKSLVSVVYVGESLCGHAGIVHGGFLATMLDEGLARCCFGALPHNIGVTANLTVDYRKPTPAGSFLVLRAETTRVEGRKAWVRGRIESLAGEGEAPSVYAEATALFVSPKFAAMMPKIA